MLRQYFEQSAVRARLKSESGREKWAVHYAHGETHTYTKAQLEAKFGVSEIRTVCLVL